MAMATEALATTMRPLVVKLERAVSQLIECGDVPTKPIPRIEAESDGSGKQWTDTDIDTWRLRLNAMPALETGGSLFIAEQLIAGELGIEPPTARDRERPWTPQGEVINVFLEDYLNAAYGASAQPTPTPFDDPADIAFREQVKRLHAFLSETHFSGELLVLIAGVTITAQTLQLEPGLEIVPFSTALRDELWSIAGWGSTAVQPLQAHDFFDIAYAISATVDGERLGGWNWGTAQRKAECARLALLLGGATTASFGVSWLRVSEPFASYLRRLGAHSGLARRPVSPLASRRTSLTPEQTAELPDIYALLASSPEHGSFALALRRLESSAERLSREDRLIDYWIAFEALFAPDTKTELRFRASLRIARYLGSDAEKRRAIAAGLRKAYDWRSHVVHGGADPTPKELKRMGELDDAVSLCEQTLRRALSKWLLAPADLREIDDLFLD
jgi:Apea-like HEPN